MDGQLAAVVVIDEATLLKLIHKMTDPRPRGADHLRQVVLTTRNDPYHYVVESTEITDPSDVSVLAASDRDRLTLITRYPFSFLGSAPERFIVRARPSRS